MGLILHSNHSIKNKGKVLHPNLINFDHSHNGTYMQNE